MKRICTVLMLLIGLLGSTAAAGLDSVRVVVMDTTNALIPNATVKLNCREQYKTGVDGCVMLALTGSKKLKVEAENYKPLAVLVHSSETEVIVRLEPKKQKSYRQTYRHGRKSGAGRREVMYMTTSASYKMRAGAPVDAMYIEGVMLSEDESMVGYERAGNGMSAGQLTAGEVNDFAKWRLWPALLQGKHKQYIDTWGLHLDRRFCVQLTNQDGYPLANRFVSLTDNRGNTLFQARTDNTGKAELWASLTDKQQTDKYYIEVEGQRVEAHEFAEQLNTIVLDSECGSEPEADVMFVVDATGSMSDEISYLQAEMKDVIRRSQGAVLGLRIRTGVLVYRDYEDDYLTRISRLTDDIDLTQQFIDRQYAMGGGDYEEAIPEALKAALSVGDWNDNARARIIYMVLDAPCHEDSATLSMLHEQIRNAAAMGIRVVPVVCSGLDEKGELLMREIALATNGTSFFLTDDSGIGHSHLKPTTDSIKVEHLNDMLVRTIVTYTAMPNCAEVQSDEDQNIEAEFLPNPFSEQELEQDESIPHGETTLYLIDMSGKLITILRGDMSTIKSDEIKTRYGLAQGVYFIKAYYNGRWHTRKLLIDRL